tara:strand:+ start:1053 stop:2156 length:1104 start_codon:yes stop_codon:yes gene_type:complete
MKNLKKILIPVSLIALVVGIFSFTNHQEGDDEKCKIKIVKIVDGVTTEVDSTFNCSDKMEWISSFGGKEGEPIHKMIKMLMVEGGDSNSFSFDINIESDEENAMKFTDEDGKEMEMHFDMKMLDGEDGVMKMMINGKEMEIKLGDMEKHLNKLHEHLEIIDDEGNVEIIIDSEEDGEEAHTVKIIKTVDDEGSVTIKKIVDGEEVEIGADELNDTYGNHKVMMIKADCENSTMNELIEMVIDINVDGEKGDKMQQIVIISKMTSSDKAAENVPTAVDLTKKELGVEKLRFSPNPNDGKFELNFKLKEKKPVQVKIVDMQGKEVYNEKVNNFSGEYANKIDISGNGEGIYILQISQENKASTSKIVIK